MWLTTLPGAMAGWGLLLVVASIRLLAQRATRDLDAARELLHLASRDEP